MTCYCGVRDSAHAKQMRAAKLPDHDYEPWHYRWVGSDVATAVTGSRRTLREFQTGIR
jgi:hypothetical protein